MNSNILLTNIQRFSLHDGPGIRTTCFLKGCSLHCPWCSNPENFSFNIQKYVKEGKEGNYGLYYTAEELYEAIIKDKPFYTGDINRYTITKADEIGLLPGGVTFSGGESLLQTDSLTPLLKKLAAEHIHTTVETCLFIPESNLNVALKYIDLFYVDVKILDGEKCQSILKGDLNLYYRHLNKLLHSGKPVVIRVPVIGGYTDNNGNREKVAKLISSYVEDEQANMLKVELLKEHNLGASKYKSLAKFNDGYDVPNYKGVSDELMNKYKKEIIDRIGDKIPVEICSI